MWEGLKNKAITHLGNCCPQQNFPWSFPMKIHHFQNVFLTFFVINLERARSFASNTKELVVGKNNLLVVMLLSLIFQHDPSLFFRPI